MATLVLRLLIFLAFAFWVGGFFFYGTVVIHTGRDVLGSHRLQGFITQRVSVWINLVSLPTLCLFYLGGRAVRPALPGTARGLAVLLALMGTIQVVLFWMHPVLGQMMDPATRKLSNRQTFDRFHMAYMTLSAVQQFAAVLFVAVLVVAWRWLDTHRGVGTQSPVSPANLSVGACDDLGRQHANRPQQ